jgi:DNA-directed RNA polymerase II subunit RPB9
MNTEYEEDVEEQEQSVGMKFCAECNNMLYPKENKQSKRLEYVCRRCNHREESTQFCVYRNDIKASNE